MNSFIHKWPASPRSRPFLLFAPFLLLYAAIVIVLAKDELIIDEPSYLGYVDNLLHGFYSPPPPDIDLWHAPGYPLLITPLVAAGAPLMVIRLLNAIFLYLSIVIFYKLMEKLVSPRLAFYASLLFGCYWLAWKGLPVIMTETFVFFLITSIAYLAWKVFEQEKLVTKQLLLLSFLLGYLALTRFLFGYVLIAALIIFAVIWLLRNKAQYKKATLIFAFAFIVTLPWLGYTWSLTGRILYWGNSGGTTVYWISTPHENEYGEWFNMDLQPNESVDGNVPDAKEQLEAHHRSIIDSLMQFRGVARDEAFKQKGIENIRHHPGKYASNWLANVGRLLFNYPMSYRKHGIGTLANALPNLLLVVAAVILLIPSIRMRRQMPFFIKFLLLAAAIYFGGSTLISGTIRMFYVIFPLLAVWLVYTGGRLVAPSPHKKL